MKAPDYCSRRKVLLITALGAGLALVPALGNATSLTGVDALDDTAVPVRRPAGVILEAIVRTENRLVAVGEHGVIIYSDDEGANWLQASVPVDVLLTCVAFANPMLGWAAGHFGVILNTTDGGKTWTKQLDGLQADQLTYAAAQSAMTLESSSPGAPYAVRRAGIFLRAGPNKPFLALLVLSSKKVIVFGAYRMTMMTTDGGRTWADFSLHIGDALSHNLYAAIIVKTDMYVAGEAGLVFCSTDGGNSFPQVASPAEVTLFGILAADDGSILVFGVAGSVFRSTDGGNTWAPITVATQDNIPAGCKLNSGGILLASEAGLLFLSKDNGATFKPVPDVPPMSVFDMYQTPDGNLIVVGGAGVIHVAATVLNI